jgi:hypothetical protein
MCFDLLYKSLLKHFSLSEVLSHIWPKVYIGLHVKYSLFLAGFKKLEFSRQVFKKKLLKYPTS